MGSPEKLEEQDGVELKLPERRQRRSHIGTMRAIKAAHARERTPLQRAADWMTRRASSASFLAFHVFWFVAWVVINTGLTPIPPFDPYPFGFLTMVVSLEAIFLSIFVLMSQNRESHIAEVREELGLQVALRMEAEVTKTLQLVAGLFTRLGHKVGEDPELQAMLQPLQPEEMERELIQQIQDAMRRTPDRNS